MSLHAKLSASGAHRWMVCPGSVEMEEGFPDTRSSFAEYGTAGHELAEACLKRETNADHFIGETFNDVEVDPEMVDAVQTYLDYVRNHTGTLNVELRVDFSPWVPDGFGTCDCLILEQDTAHVIDLKMGKGVRVDAENNPQAMLYALGALNDYEFLYEINVFKLAIVQPRLDHISEHVITREELLAFGKHARERAELALQKDAELFPQEHACRFCKAKGQCRALAEYSLKTATEGFETLDDPITLKDPKKLSNDEIAGLLHHVNLVSDWVKAVESHALSELEACRVVPGYKLVEGRSNRKWVDDKNAEKALRRSRLKVSDIFSKKLISPSQAEKLIGKNHPVIKEFAVKPKGKPTIAPESDSRPPLYADALEGFSAVI